MPGSANDTDPPGAAEGSPPPAPTAPDTDVHTGGTAPRGVPDASDAKRPPSADLNEDPPAAGSTTGTPPEGAPTPLPQGSTPTAAATAEPPGGKGVAGAQQQDTPPEWEVGEDAAYRDFFRLEDPGGAHDKLSLLSCRRQGVRAEELLWRGVDAFPAPTEEKAEARQQAFLRRRVGLFKELEAERTAIFTELYSYAKSKNKLRLARMLAGCIDTAVPSPSVSPPEEGGGGQRLLQAAPDKLKASLLSPVSVVTAASSASSFERSVAVADVGPDAKDIEMFRMKEMRQVVNERKLEVERQKLEQAIHLRTEQSERLAQERVARVAREAVATQRRRRALLQRVHDHTQIVGYQRRLDLDHKNRLREEHEAQFHAEQRRKLDEKREQSAAKLRMVQERAERVFEEEAGRCIAQHASLHQRLRTHEAKKENLSLRQEERFARRRLGAMQKLVAVMEVSERDKLEEQQRVVSQAHAEREQESRLAARRSARNRMMREKVALEDARAARVSKNRSLLESRKNEAHDEMVQRNVQKEAYLRRQQQDRADALHRKQEEAGYRYQLTQENMDRLRCKTEHRALVQHRKIELDNQDKEERDRARRLEVVIRDKRKRDTDLARKKVREDIERMKMSEKRRGMSAQVTQSPVACQQQPQAALPSTRGNCVALAS